MRILRNRRTISVVGRSAGTRRREGFSLVEVMVGMGVVGIGCVALYSGLASGVGMVRISRESERSTQIMAEKLDTIRLYSWDKITNASYIPATFTKFYTPGDGGMTYTGTVEIAAAASLPAAYGDNMRQVTVSLTWVTGSMSHHRRMTTYVAKDGMQNYIY